MNRDDELEGSDEGATQLEICDEERKAMAAYIVVEIEVLDKERYENYKQMVPSSLAAFGGKFLVRGGDAGGDVVTQASRHSGIPFGRAGEGVVGIN